MSKKIKPRAFSAIVPLAIGGAIAFAGGQAANAFELSNLSGIVEGVAPYLGIDVESYMPLIEGGLGLVDAVSSSDYGAAAEIIAGTLGEYGSPDPQKVRQSASEKAKDVYSETAKDQDFGAGEAGYVAQYQAATKETMDKAQDDYNQGSTAQEVWKKNAEGLTESVTESINLAQDSEGKDNSLEVTKNLSKQYAINGGIAARNVTETVEVKRSLLRQESTLNAMYAQGAQSDRAKSRQANSSIGDSIITTGTFAGMVGNTNNKSEETGDKIAISKAQEPSFDSASPNFSTGSGIEPIPAEPQSVPTPLWGGPGSKPISIPVPEPVTQEPLW